jgi:antitoxin component YwqK of YwqJK toxin-antitoxin module
MRKYISVSADLLRLGFLQLFMLVFFPVACQEKYVTIFEENVVAKEEGNEMKTPYYYTFRNGKPLDGKFRVNWYPMDPKRRDPRVDYIFYWTVEFKNGYKNGLFTEFRNDKLYKKVEYCLGLPCGVYETYFDNGILTEQRYYNSKQELHGKVTAFENGKKKRETQYVDGLKHGIEIDYYPTGEVWTETTFMSGKEHGEQRHYNSKTKRLDMIRNYKHGVVHGKYQEFANNGEIEHEKTFTEGQLDGVWKMYRMFQDKPVLYFERPYKMGKRHGKEIEYDITGQGTIVNVAYYVNDEAVSEEEFKKTVE